MKKPLQYLIFLGATLMTSLMGQAEASATDKTAYDFEFTSLAGDAMPLSAYRGKVLLVVNTASKCGFTGQYKGLQALHEAYKDKGLVIIGVPSNDFGGQEPGSEKQIKEFCELNYGVSFPMTSKVEVTGKNAHPLYVWLTETLGFGSGPKWNFHKYLIGKNGMPVDHFSSITAPDSDKLKAAIDKEISK
ncbi:MAG: glutathione peroxidase [Alphaproteobacteria bacterium]|nr:glutathione peroxidase [Alphaproteobacteria bacterium]